MEKEPDSVLAEKAVKGPLYLEPNLRVIFGVTLMAVLGVASITPAFPRVIRDLGIAPRQVGLLITVFTFPGIVLSPVVGILADRVGRKRILVPSLVLFALAGGACALTRDFGLLLFFRFLQGTAAAPLGSLYAVIIGDLYSGQQRAAAMGYNASVLSVGTAIYPALGGALALLGWSYPFFLPLLALPVAMSVQFRLRSPEPRTAQSMRQYLAAAWQVLNSAKVAGIFSVSVATFILLYGSFLTYFPLLASDRFAASTFVIGILTTAMSVTTAIVSTQVGRLARRFSEKNLVAASFFFYGAALLTVPLIPRLEFLVLASLAYGVGHGLNIPSLLSLVASLGPMQQRGIVMSLNGMVLRLGQTLGPLVMGVAFTAWGSSGPFFAGAALAGTVFVVGVFVVR